MLLRGREIADLGFEVGWRSLLMAMKGLVGVGLLLRLWGLVLFGGGCPSLRRLRGSESFRDWWLGTSGERSGVLAMRVRNHGRY